MFNKYNHSKRWNYFKYINLRIKIDKDYYFINDFGLGIYDFIYEKKWWKIIILIWKWFYKILLKL